ncbi:MAG: sterol desaturase family protein [Sandaracinaceae bacterium]|nr:sterol desaturase family protein [Sandaracinaceae bacterium]
MSSSRTFGWAIAGLAVSPFLEYAWHAWIAHGKGRHPTRVAHLEHHRTAHTEGDPWAEIRENAPRIVGTAAAVAVVLTPFVGASRALGLATGLGAGYVAITLSHNRMHERGPRTPFEDALWRAHFHHHYADPTVDFGLTSLVFDRLLGTAVDPERVVIRVERAPSWWARDRAAGERARIHVEG